MAATEGDDRHASIDANPPQRRETQDEESSSGGQAPQISTRYSLRSRHVDLATQSRRDQLKKEREMKRERRIQAERLRIDKEIKGREFVAEILKFKAMMHAQSDAWEKQQEKLRLSKQGGGGDDGKGGSKQVYTYETINKPPGYRGWIDLIPYEPDLEFGTEFELKHLNWQVEKFTLELARCVVGLECFAGDTEIFSCSGTIVEYVDDTGYVLTSASLIRCPEKDEQVDKPKVAGLFSSYGQKLEGSVSNVDFYYNICMIKVPCTSHLTSKSFNQNSGIFNFYENRTRDVVAVGRTCEPCGLKVASGKLIPRKSRFDCDELLVSSCKISQKGVGGPLMDFDGNIIGMNFYDKKGTPFLPSFIVLKCLQHFDNFGKVIRPLHGLQVENLYEADLSVLEQMVKVGVPERCGVIVVKVQEPSTELSEIKVGEIITHVDGVPFSNAAELGGVLLDMCGKLWLDRQKLNLSDDLNEMAAVMSLKFRVRTYSGFKSEVTTRTINVHKFTPSRLDRWPLPRPIIIRKLADGKIVDEEWYMTAED